MGFNRLGRVLRCTGRLASVVLPINAEFSSGHSSVAGKIIDTLETLLFLSIFFFLNQNEQNFHSSISIIMKIFRERMTTNTKQIQRIYHRERVASYTRVSTISKKKKKHSHHPISLTNPLPFVTFPD